jgi:transposase-like protein
MSQASAEKWSGHIRSWRESGLTAKEFAARVGIKESTFAYWRWKLRSAGTGGGKAGEDVRAKGRATETQPKRRPKAEADSCRAFVELAVAVPGNRPPAIEVWLGAKTRVIVPVGFDEATLTGVLRAVEAWR